MHLAARTVTDVVTHLPVSMQPVEATADCLQGLGDSEVSRVIMESLKDQPLGVLRVGYHNAVSLPL